MMPPARPFRRAISNSAAHSPVQYEQPRRKIVVCHHGHDNDTGYTQNLFEFFSAQGVNHSFLDLRLPETKDELRRDLANGQHMALLGFNSQLDHAWLDDEPLPVVAARHGVVVVQWICDHPGSCWPEFNYSNGTTSRFVFHSPYSEAYFQKFCCPGALTTTAGSMGPNGRSRCTKQGVEAFSQRPIACLIALGLTRLGRSAAQTETEIGSLDARLAGSLRKAIADARFDLDGPIEIHLLESLEQSRLALDTGAFNRCFRLLNDSVQYFRRGEIIRIASQFGVHIQSDETARAFLEGGCASFRSGVSSPETLDNMPYCRAVLSVSPVNDSIHDRICNALNAGCLPILEDNRAHRGLFTHNDNAVLFRYGDDSLAECLAIACGSPERTYMLAERATALRDQSPFRFGSFRNIVTLVDHDPGQPSASRS